MILSGVSVLTTESILTSWSDGDCLLQRLLLLMMRAATHEVDEEPATSHQDDDHLTLISNKMLN